MFKDEKFDFRLALIIDAAYNRVYMFFIKIEKKDVRNFLEILKTHPKYDSQR